RSLRPLRLAVLASTLLLAAALGVACTDDSPGSATETPTGAATQGTPSASADATRTTSNARDNTTIEGALDICEVVAEVGDSVVLIESVSAGLGAGVSGSGLVIDQDGHILTNFHVVQGQQTLKVTLPSGAASLAAVVGSDPANDLAV